MTIKIRRVKADRYGDTLLTLRCATAPEDSHINDFTNGDWFIAFDGKEPVALAGIRKSLSMPGYAYMMFSGVLPGWRGQGLQKKLIKKRERHAKKNGCVGIITDTRPSAGQETVISSNNLQKMGYWIFYPPVPWGYEDTHYWIKRFDGKDTSGVAAEYRAADPEDA